MFRLFEYKAERDYISIRNFLREKGFSRAVVVKLKSTENGILLNGSLAFTNAKIKSGDVITVKCADESVNYEVDNSLDLNVLYEDEDYLIADKPPYMAVHPTLTIKDKTLANAFATYCKENDLSLTFRPINRLDKNTSGIVILAKNKPSATACKDIKKTYIAVCHGKCEKQGVIDGPISLCEGSIIKRCVSDEGKKAVTEFECLYTNGEYSIIKLNLLTGRTHQIRVHMSSIGRPLVGDDLYGGKTDLLLRQALHCSKVSFVNSLNGDVINIKSELPEDIKDFINNYVSGIESDLIVY